MQRLLATRRMRNVQNIHISEEGAVSEELLKVIVKHPGLRQITFSCRNLFRVDPRLLGQLVNGLEEVRMTDTRLTRQQVDNIFVGLTGETKLKRLSILNAILTSVDPGLLARAVAKLEPVELPRDLAQLTDQQLEAVYTAVAGGETKVKRLSVRISSIELELLARAVNQLEYLGATLTSRQAEVILTQSLLKTSLKKMLIRISQPTYCNRSSKVDKRFSC